MGYNPSGILTLTAGEDLEPYRRVKFSGSTSRTVVYADAGEEAIGVTQAEADSGDPVAVATLGYGGTVEVESAGAITVNADVYGAADGKVDDTASGLPFGKALDAAAAAAIVIEVLPMSGESTQAADVTELTDNSGGVDPADDTIAVITTAAEITDNSTGVDPTDDTIAAITEAATITDSSTGADPGDDTIAAITEAVTITDNSGGADPGDDTIAVIADPSGSAAMVPMTNVAAAASAATQLDIAAASGGEAMTTPVQPTHPRNIVITVTDGDTSISAFAITVSGTAPDGTAITEVFSFADGLVQTGDVVFATLTSVVLTSVTGNGAGDLLDAAWGVKLGVSLPYGSTGLSIVKLSVDGTIEAAAATDTTNNSFTATTAPNGAHDYEVWYEWTGPATTAITAAVAQLAAKTNTNSLAVDSAADAVAQLAAKLNTDSTAVTATSAAVAQVAAKMNTNSTAVDSAADAVAQLAAKTNVNSLAVGSAADAVAQLTAKVNIDSAAITAVSAAVAQLTATQTAIIASLQAAGVMAV